MGPESEPRALHCWSVSPFLPCLHPFGRLELGLRPVNVELSESGLNVECSCLMGPQGLAGREVGTSGLRPPGLCPSSTRPLPHAAEGTQLSLKSCLNLPLTVTFIIKNKFILASRGMESYCAVIQWACHPSRLGTGRGTTGWSPMPAPHFLWLEPETYSALTFNLASNIP